MANDSDPQGSGEPRLSRMSLDSLKVRLEREQQAREAMRHEMAERLAEHDKKPKGVSPLWLAGGLLIAMGVVVGLIFMFPPAAVREWTLDFDSSPVDVDIPGPIPEPEPVVEAPAEEAPAAEETTTRRPRRPATRSTSSSSSMASAPAAPDNSHDNDPLYGL
jgi:hypothetical protein